MLAYEKARRLWELQNFRRRWLWAFWNIYIFINLGIILSKNICWPTKYFQDCCLKRTISEHSLCSSEIVLFFQKMASIRSDHPFSVFSMVLLSRCDWNFFLSSSFQKKKKKKVCFQNLVLLKTSPSWSAFHKLPTYFP